MDFTGRPMKSMIFVQPAGCTDRPCCTGSPPPSAMPVPCRPNHPNTPCARPGDRIQRGPANDKPREPRDRKEIPSIPSEGSFADGVLSELGSPVRDADLGPSSVRGWRPPGSAPAAHHRLPPPPPDARPRSSGDQRVSESDLISVGELDLDQLAASPATVPGTPPDSPAGVRWPSWPTAQPNSFCAPASIAYR
jgi:hypothetical protein